MARVLIIMLLTALATKVFAQSEKAYKERAAEIQNEIWNDTLAAFRVKDVPAQMNSENAVIIATSDEMINTAKSIFKISGPARKLNYQITSHERVKINSKAALDEYSMLDYTKNYNQSHVSLYDFWRNMSDTYIGVKIIRPNGTETIVNTDEEVLAKTKDYKGKLPIPGLQPGDILDYYVRVEQVQDIGSTAGIQGPYTFQIGSAYSPILYFNVRFQLDEGCGVEYINANGAPPFKQSKDADSNIVLELTQTNLPRIQDTLWTSPMRQYPYITLQYEFIPKGQKGANYDYGIKRGEVRQGDVSEKIATQFEIHAQLLSLQSESLWRKKTDVFKLTQDYLGGSANMKQIPQDSIIKILYSAWRYNILLYSMEDTSSFTSKVRHGWARSLDNAIKMSKMLSSLNIDRTIYLVCSRFEPGIQNVINISDLDALVKVNTDNGRTYWFAFNDVVTNFNEIPSELQGEDALTVKSWRGFWNSKGPKSGDLGHEKVPLTTAADNTIAETLNVNFDSSDMQILHVEQTSRQTGAMRHDDQKLLLPIEDIEANAASALSQKKLVDRLNDDKEHKDADKFSAAFATDRSNQKEYFTNEINAQYNNMPKDVSAYEIKQQALLRDEDSFVYRCDFSMENFVKRDGDNYMLDLGKLISSDQNPQEKESTRNFDIYMPCARTLSWDIIINVPKGYNAKGTDDMNKSVSNETGSFKCIATNNGSTVEIKVIETYAHNFEPAANWPKLLALSDALFNLSGQKILLEKNRS